MKEGKRKRVVEEGVSELNWKEDEGAGFAKKNEDELWASHLLMGVCDKNCWNGLG